MFRPPPGVLNMNRIHTQPLGRMQMRRGAGKTLSVAAAIAVVGAVSACGGQQQNVSEPSGNFPVQIVHTSFPPRQRLAQRTTLVIRVRNTGTQKIPNLAVTICNTTCGYPAPVGQGTSVQPFSYYLNMPGLAYHSRPVWIVDKPPGACPPAYPANGPGYSCAAGGPGSYFTVGANTWAMNQALPPGGTVTFSWGVTAVTPGRYVVAWKVAAGIYGKAKAVLATGSSLPGVSSCAAQINQAGVCGAFSVKIVRPPQQQHVNDNGTVVPGA